MKNPTYNAHHTVEFIVHNGLCTQCGFCKSVCPAQAIVMKEAGKQGEIFPAIDPNTCIMCSLCRKVCPGESVDFDALYKSYLGVEHYKKYLGHVDEAYLGYATDYQHRYDSASGGVLTTLAAFAVEHRYLDYVLCARATAHDPFHSETILTDNPEELKICKGSIYFPVPLGEGIDLLIKNHVSPEAKLGIIGLPCHTHAALKLQAIDHYKHYTWTFIFGLFCGGTFTYTATNKLITQLGERRNDITSWAFRGEGWPGRIHYTLRNGQKKSLKRQQLGIFETLRRSTLFKGYSFNSPHRCFTCSDGLAELADISFGDPWLKSQKNETVGKTLIIARTKNAIELLQKAERANVVKLTPLTPQMVLVAQKGMLVVKKNYIVFNHIVRWLKKRAVPSYNYSWQTLHKSPKILYLFAFIAYFNHLLGRSCNYLPIHIILGGVHAIVGFLVKKKFLTLTDEDDQSYFT